MIFRAACLVITVVALGMWFAYINHFANLMRRRIEIDERFCNMAEDLEIAVLAVQIDVTNLQQTVNEALRKRG